MKEKVRDQYTLMAKASLRIADRWQKTLMDDCGGPRRDVVCILSGLRAHFLAGWFGLATEGEMACRVENQLCVVKI